MADEAWYLWSNYQNDGETDTVRTPNGGDRNVVLSRNVTKAGTKVTAGSFASKEEFESLKEAGVVRNYPYPEMPAGSNDSPIVFLQKQLNLAAQSEEERLTAQVTGATSSDEALALAGAEATKEQEKKQ